MKKRYLLILLLFATFMVGCGTSSKNNTQGPSNTQETADNYLTESRKKAYIDTIISYMSATRNVVNMGNKLSLYDTSILYMVPVGNDTAKSCISVETGGQSPFSDTWNYAFVGVKYTGEGYNYYLIAEDGKGYGIPFSTPKELTDNGNLLYTSDNSVNKDLREYLKKKYNESNNGKVDLSTNDKIMIESYDELSDVEKIEYISTPNCRNE